MSLEEASNCFLQEKEKKSQRVLQTNQSDHKSEDSYQQHGKWKLWIIFLLSFDCVEEV